MTTTESILNKIKDWPIAASQDDRKLFYDDGNLADLEIGKKDMVVGRKGSGKSAICEHFNDKFGRQALQTTTTDFPWNLFARLQDMSFAAAARYVTVWKFVILRSALQLLDGVAPEQAKTIYEDPTVRTFLLSIGVDPRQNLKQKLGDLVSSLAQREIKIAGTGIGAQTSAQSMATPSVADFNRIVLSAFETINVPPLYILFDGLDDNFNPHAEPQERREYQYQVAGLLAAAEHIRSELRDRRPIRPIIFIRSDLLDFLQGLYDTNKTSDRSVNLHWDARRLARLVNFRLSRELELSSPEDDFDSVWTQVFTRTQMSRGKGRSQSSMFDQYILNQTLQRPRDVIAFMRCCAGAALSMGKERVPVDAVRSAQQPYSTHFKNEFINELSPSIPDAARAFKVFNRLRKRHFSFSELSDELTQMQQSGDVDLQGKTSEQFAKTLFEASVIGVLAPGNVYEFRYLVPSSSFATRRRLGLHRGLHHEFNIQL
ncbi:P-loop ATPase, Sll1717 family [Terricaulis sp.]|uniref:P-loop ATPase, Sll1717 family n=1 Tax=Terricaulis sp. TaxID=2768686 RepID=UPI002AC74168|nr:hypothetical protein [Terricaulis sp.]MDZ4689818.1 hypothetical protein [Terricaulis sp.]